MTDVVCDLDGVIYRGATLIEGADNGLRKLVSTGTNLLFATNNSTRTPAEVSAKILGVTGVDVEPDQVVTSAEAAASTIPNDGGPVFVVGERGIHEALRARDIEVTENHLSADVVVVGLCRDLSYGLLSDAANAIRGGARFVATNTDPTFPTSGGLEPGAGAIVSAIAVSSNTAPAVAGKPHTAMRTLIKTKLSSDTWVIGDRMDTDIEMAERESGWRSILVLTGVTTRDEPTAQANYVVDDFNDAVDLVLGTPHRQ